MQVGVHTGAHGAAQADRRGDSEEHDDEDTPRAGNDRKRKSDDKVQHYCRCHVHLQLCGFADIHERNADFGLKRKAVSSRCCWRCSSFPLRQAD